MLSKLVWKASEIHRYGNLLLLRNLRDQSNIELLSVWRFCATGRDLDEFTCWSGGTQGGCPGSSAWQQHSRAAWKIQLDVAQSSSQHKLGAMCAWLYTSYVHQSAKVTLFTRQWVQIWNVSFEGGVFFLPSIKWAYIQTNVLKQK